MSIDFLLVSLVVVLAPGIGVVYTLSAALSRGARAGAVAAFGCTLGILPHMMAAILGLAAVLNASAIAFQSVKYLGVAYLVYLAWQTLRKRGGLAIEKSERRRSDLQVVGTAVLVNLLNPKLSIFFFAFLPQFLSVHEANPIPKMALLSSVFMAMTFAVFLVYGSLAALVRDHIVSRPRVLAWMRRTFAAAFVLLAAKLAVVER